MQKSLLNFKVFVQKTSESIFLILIYFFIIGPTYVVIKILNKDLLVKKPKKTNWEDFSGLSDWFKMY